MTLGFRRKMKKIYTQSSFRGCWRNLKFFLIRAGSSQETEEIRLTRDDDEWKLQTSSSDRGSLKEIQARKVHVMFSRCAKCLIVMFFSPPIFSRRLMTSRKNSIRWKGVKSEKNIWIIKREIRAFFTSLSFFFTMEFQHFFLPTDCTTLYAAPS